MSEGSQKHGRSKKQGAASNQPVRKKQSGHSSALKTAASDAPKSNKVGKQTCCLESLESTHKGGMPTSKGLRPDTPQHRDQEVCDKFNQHDLVPKDPVKRLAEYGVQQQRDRRKRCMMQFEEQIRQVTAPYSCRVSKISNATEHHRKQGGCSYIPSDVFQRKCEALEVYRSFLNARKKKMSKEQIVKPERTLSDRCPILSSKKLTLVIPSSAGDDEKCTGVAAINAECCVVTAVKAYDVGSLQADATVHAEAESDMSKTVTPLRISPSVCAKPYEGENGKCLDATVPRNSLAVRRLAMDAYNRWNRPTSPAFVQDSFDTLDTARVPASLSSSENADALIDAAQSKPCELISEYEDLLQALDTYLSSSVSTKNELHQESAKPSRDSSEPECSLIEEMAQSSGAATGEVDSTVPFSRSPSSDAFPSGTSERPDELALSVLLDNEREPEHYDMVASKEVHRITRDNCSATSTEKLCQEKSTQESYKTFDIRIILFVILVTGLGCILYFVWMGNVVEYCSGPVIPSKQQYEFKHFTPRLYGNMTFLKQISGNSKISYPSQSAMRKVHAVQSSTDTSDTGKGRQPPTESRHVPAWKKNLERMVQFSPIFKAMKVIHNI